MSAIFENDFTEDCRIIFEHSIAYGDYSYDVIYGRHVNGGFICVPNWKIACEASLQPSAVGYNAEKLTDAGLDLEVAKAIAGYIAESFSIE